MGYGTEIIEIMNNIEDNKKGVEPIEGAMQSGVIEDVNIDQEMRSAYIDYSMSVIVSRALPDARDGLKPVQRRVLYGMDGLGLDYSGQTKKCARIVGDVLGKFHPHGDSSVYDAMVRLAQWWNQRYPLIYGQGNFGSMDGDAVAAMRYTEAKLQKISNDILCDLDKNTVDFQWNFDDSIQEPTVLSTKVPLLLLNGSSGIAVGMATNMAPHNLGECCDAICAYIDNPDIDVDGLMQHIKGPDFPTGGIIQGVQGIREAYATGRGRVVVRAKTEIEVDNNGRETIVVTEIPYMVNKREMLERISQMVEDKRIEGITYMNDESSREGIRVIFRVKQGSNANVVLNTLFKYTPLQSSFSINNVALVKGRPRTLTLKDIISVFVDFRHEVIVRRTKFDLAKAQKRAHLVEGLIRAIDVIDRIVEIMKTSKNVEEAKNRIMEEFSFTELQAAAIVEMRIRQLTGLEHEKLQAEYDELQKFIAYCNEVLASPELQLSIIRDETMAIKAAHADKRRSEIVPSADELTTEDFYDDIDVVITISHYGYIKRTPLSEYRTQNRGGVGMKGSATRDEDFIEHLYVANMRSTMMFFTESGKCFRLKVYEVPEMSRSSKGRAIQNVLNLSDDRIKAVINVPTLKDEEYINNHFIILATKQGIIKKTTLVAYSGRIPKDGLNAVNVREGDELIDVMLTDGRSEILIASKNGRCVRFEESKARPIGRTAIGVRGIQLDDDDVVIGAVCYEPEKEDASAHTLLVVGDKGLGKRTDFEEYRKTNRGSKGVRTMNITEKTGKVVAMKNVTEDNDLLIITQSGIIIRMAVADIKQAGRNTQGVKLINIRENDSIASISVVAKSEEPVPQSNQSSPESQGSPESQETQDSQE